MSEFSGSVAETLTGRTGSQSGSKRGDLRVGGQAGFFTFLGAMIADLTEEFQLKGQMTLEFHS